MPGWQLARSAATIAIRWRGDLDHCDATFGERHQCAALDEPVRLLLTGDEVPAARQPPIFYCLELPQYIFKRLVLGLVVLFL